MEEDLEDDGSIGAALRWSLVCFLGVGFLIAVAAWALQDRAVVEQAEEQEVVLPEEREVIPEVIPVLPFTDITSDAGISFVHNNGANGEKLLPETMGGGCAFFDYDSDGDQDLLLINSQNWPWDSVDNDSQPALYLNDGAGKFTDHTEQAGLAISLYGMGVAVGDYDNDGDPDLFVSAVGKNLLLQNKDGVYVDATEQAGVGGAESAWSTSCGWLDIDNDGLLDLVVGNYVRWTREIDQTQDFRLTGIGRAYGPPLSFEGSFPYLYKNNGDGTFEDISESSGVQQTNMVTDAPLAKTLGVAPIDANQDGWIDFILANDTVRNLLFINKQDGTFEEMGIEAGIAFDSSGKARGAMGIDAARFRGASTLGVAIANFANEMTALYVADGESVSFTDDAIPTGLGPPTRSDLSFGLFFFDADLDGRLDLFAANGHLEDEIEVVQSSQKYQQPPVLFWNAGDTGADEFVRIASDESIDLYNPLVGRGAAYADIDSDGDLDLLVTQIAGPPALLRNDLETTHYWLRLKLVGQESNRDAIGAWVEVQRGETTIARQVMPTRSYLSQVELPVTIGLGDDASYDKITVRWPSGKVQEIAGVAVNSEAVVTEPGGSE